MAEYIRGLVTPFVAAITAKCPPDRIAQAMDTTVLIYGCVHMNIRELPASLMVEIRVTNPPAYSYICHNRLELPATGYQFKTFVSTAKSALLLTFRVTRALGVVPAEVEPHR